MAVIGALVCSMQVVISCYLLFTRLCARPAVPQGYLVPYCFLLGAVITASLSEDGLTGIDAGTNVRRLSAVCADDSRPSSWVPCGNWSSFGVS